MSTIGLYELSAHCIKFRKSKLIYTKKVVLGLNLDNNVLADSFGKQQESSLEDYIQLSVIMQYNYRNDNRLLIHVSFFIIVKCMMFSPFF